MDAFRGHLRRRFSAAAARRVLYHVRRFIDYLDESGVAVPAPAAVQPSEPRLLCAFRQWMKEHRGVTEATLTSYGRPLREFVAVVGDDPAGYNVRSLRDFLLGYEKNHGRTGGQKAAIALRSFLRFLIAEGQCAASLDVAFPPIIRWRLSSLPRYLPAHEIQRVLAGCDPSTVAGRRELAVLLLLSQLGLRASDVIRLRLEDIDWEKATLCVAGKGRREALLPLPQAVGDAILAYLEHGRRSTPYSDRLFLRTHAPIGPWRGANSVSGIVATAIRRAGISCHFHGAHVLRHSAATEMLRQGATLDQIGALLRHRSRESTALYAKVDFGLLRTIAQPWPEVTPC
jgi:site-specific recombinase XerD